MFLNANYSDWCESLTDNDKLSPISYIQCCMLVRFLCTNFKLITEVIIKYFFRAMAKISLSSKEIENIIGLLERQIRMADKALRTPTMGYNNYDDFKNQINNNNITIKKLQNDTTRKS